MPRVNAPFPVVYRRSLEALVAGYVLTGALADATGGWLVHDVASVALRSVFTPGANSGALRLQVQGSSEPATTLPAALVDWEGVEILDGASFAAGAIDDYNETRVYMPAPALAEARIYQLPDVTAWTWLRVLAMDDGVGPLLGALDLGWTAVVG